MYSRAYVLFKHECPNKPKQKEQNKGLKQIGRVLISFQFQFCTKMKIS